MKTLVIVQHGEAGRDDVALADTQRPLTPRGRHETAAAVTKFISLGRQPDAVVASPAKRALDTADVWLKELKIPAETLRVVPEIYEAERTDILRIVYQLDDSIDTVVLVGHDPGVTALLHHLVGRGVEKMRLSSFAVIAINVDRWDRVALRESELVHYYAPPPYTGPSLWQRIAFWKR